MAEKWTNTSAPPPSTVMKPKPLSALNHFTVPCAMLNSPSENANPVMPGPMTVFEQRRREAAFQRTSQTVRSRNACRRPVIGRKQRTTYAKTAHTLPEKRVGKLPLERTEWRHRDTEKGPHFVLPTWT